MSRTSSKYELLILSLKDLVCYNYEILNDYFKNSFLLTKEANEKVNSNIIRWDNQSPNHKFTGFDLYESDFLDLLNLEKKHLLQEF